MVFQNYALYPYMTVRANLEFGLRMRKTSREVMRDRIEKVADILGLKELLNRKPGQLSDG